MTSILATLKVPQAPTLLPLLIVATTITLLTQELTLVDPLLLVTIQVCYTILNFITSPLLTSAIIICQGAVSHQTMSDNISRYSDDYYGGGYVSSGYRHQQQYRNNNNSNYYSGPL